MNRLHQLTPPSEPPGRARAGSARPTGRLVRQREEGLARRVPAVSEAAGSPSCSFQVEGTLLLRSCLHAQLTLGSLFQPKGGGRWVVTNSKMILHARASLVVSGGLRGDR